MEGAEAQDLFGKFGSVLANVANDLADGFLATQRDACARAELELRWCSLLRVNPLVLRMTKSSPGVNPNPRFGPILDSTGVARRRECGPTGWGQYRRGLNRQYRRGL